MSAFPARPRPTARRAATLLLATAPALVGCAAPGGFAGRTTSPAVGGTPSDAVETTKEVVATRPPHELLAHDGSVCRVAAAVLAATPAGAQYRCRWFAGAGGR